MTGETKTVLRWLLFGAVALIGTAGAVWYALRGGAYLPQAILILILLLLLTATAGLWGELRRSLKKTLYDYRNIMLIGALLFCAVLTVQLLIGFVPEWFGGNWSVHSVYHAVVEFPRKFSFYAVFVLSAVCLSLGISNAVLMKKEGFRPRNALSVLLAALYLGGTAAIYALSDWFRDAVLIPSGRYENALFRCADTAVTLFLLLTLCYFECVLVGTAVMGWLAARQVPKYDKDYIIILGCSIDRKGGLLPLLRGRVNRAIRYAWEQEIATGKPLKYVPSGGQGANEVISEGSAMALYLMTRGAEEYEVIPEKESRNTMENMVFSKRIIDRLDPDAKIAFATTNYHMLRSGILARMAGIDAEGIAGDTKWYFWPNGFIREFFGILALHLRTHIAVAAVLAGISIAVGIVGYFGSLI